MQLVWLFTKHGGLNVTARGLFPHRWETPPFHDGLIMLAHRHGPSSGVSLWGPFEGHNVPHRVQHSIVYFQ